MMMTVHDLSDVLRVLIFGGFLVRHRGPLDRHLRVLNVGLPKSGINDKMLYNFPLTMAVITTGSKKKASKKC